MAKYAPITLGEMGAVKLLNRTDTKFVAPMAALERLLQMAVGEYRAQETGGLRVAPYYTLYFDTPAMDMYHMHHQGHAGRQKTRVRTYVDSGESFLEVKTKNNHGRTKKKRMQTAGMVDGSQGHSLTFADRESREAYGDFMGRHLRYDYKTLERQIENRFKRVTLVNRDMTERLTIDTGLEFHNLETGLRASLDGLAIVELKRDGLAHSPILSMLNELRVKPMGFSKYCMGVVLTNPGVKRNRFKPRLAVVRKMLGQEAWQR